MGLNQNTVPQISVRRHSGALASRPVELPALRTAGSAKQKTRAFGLIDQALQCRTNQIAEHDRELPALRARLRAR